MQLSSQRLFTGGLLTFQKISRRVGRKFRIVDGFREDLPIIISIWLRDKTQKKSTYSTMLIVFWHALWLLDPQELRCNQRWSDRGHGSQSRHALRSKRGHLTMQNATRTRTAASEQYHTIVISRTHLDAGICNSTGGYLDHPEYSCYTLSHGFFLRHFSTWRWRRGVFIGRQCNIGLGWRRGGEDI